VIAAPALALALAATAADGGAAPSCGLPLLATSRPWRTGETMVLDLDLLGMVKAGALELSVERPMPGGKIVPLRARARTSAGVDAVKRFTGVAFSWIDARTLLPERYRDEADENGVRKVSDTRMPTGAPDIRIVYQYGDRKGELAYVRQGDVLDALSALYYLRAAQLSPGDRFCFDLVGNRRLWRLEGTVAARTERVDTPAGKYETLRIDAVARRADDRNAPPRPLHLWLSSDARRLLVAAVSEVDVGPVRAMLSSVRGARGP
jgi:Protein of unknown function (DUF3108)